ncbi:hypothetical protein F5882DRAFT_375856 [Hyaloscypha sp. PMI_1271]|nr:hypothetical protein F5882DRAFT_375856 [Hyaloscypha sp. PMI_1271]
MPMMYGEGGVEAFLRLQKAIMEQSDDHTLFAWKQHQGFPGHGLLATSPSLFTESSTLIRSHDASPRTAYRMSNRGLEIQLLLTSTLQGGDLIALLGCRDQDESSTLIGIYIAVMPDGRCIRTCLDQLARIGSLHDENYRLPALETIYVPQLHLPEKPPQQAYIFRSQQAVVFGVNLDGSVYGDIVGIASGVFTKIIDEMRRELRCLGEGDSEAQQRSEGPSTKNVEKEIWDLIFSLKFEQKLVDGRLVYQVCLCYRRKG